VPFTWVDAVDAPDMGHGGPVETSLLQHVRPDLVHEDRLDDAAADGADGWGEWVAGVNLAYDTDEFSENGAVGDPREGGPDRGEALLDAASEALATLLDRVATR
jgi:creatinine amidohydrolase